MYLVIYIDKVYNSCLGERIFYLFVVVYDI